MTRPDIADALVMLPVPRPDRITAEQANGLTCVWCDEPPTLHLGPRLSTHGGDLHRWTPRACQPCAARQAARVYRLHIKTCARCSHREYCSDSRALYNLAR